MKEKKENIEVQGFKISFVKETGFISLTDLARKSERDPTEVVRDWFRNSETLLFLQTWEVIHNPNFKVWEMTHFRLQVLDKTRSLGFQRYTQETLAIGLVSVSGRYGGTFAHP
ncbi:MAG: KilA-N domain-containing protein, partial [Saprospiraceae bacterium]